MIKGYYKKVDTNTAAWDLDAGCRNLVSSTKFRRNLRKKLRRNLRKALDKRFNVCYNEYMKERLEQ